LVSIPCDTSIVTKYMASSSGAMKANSIAATPRRSRQSRIACLMQAKALSCAPARTDILLSFPLPRAAVKSVFEWFVLPGHRGIVQRLAVARIRHPLAHEIGHHRPFVEHPQHVDRTGAAGLDGECVTISAQHDVAVVD